jgi:hypothetical protein
MYSDNSDPIRSGQLSSELFDFPKEERISKEELHKYVWGLMMIFAAFVITYPIACWRVSQSEKFRPYQAHIKPVTESYTPIDPN